jgi:RNA polymerase sigma factor for flagellar operon FliA
MLTTGLEINRYLEASQMNFEEDETRRREELIMKYAPLVKYIAERLAIRMPSHISKDDLTSAGILGLFDAIDNYDSSRGIKFETYAFYRIRGAVLDEMRRLDWIPRSIRKEVQEIEAAITAVRVKLGRDPEDHEIALELGVSLESYFKMIDKAKGINLLSLDEPVMGSSVTAVDKMESTTPSPLDELNKNEVKNIIADALSNLSEKEQLVVSLYYFDELTLKEIARVMELTESRISQIHSKVIITLRAKLKSYYGS